MRGITSIEELVPLPLGSTVEDFEGVIFTKTLSYSVEYERWNGGPEGCICDGNFPVTLKSVGATK